LVGILGYLVTLEANYNEASNRLGVSSTFKWSGFTLDDWQSDIQCRVIKIQITKKKQELEFLESRLDKLISPELRAKLELEEISQMLKN
jgi:hypothetical protein